MNNLFPKFQIPRKKNNIFLLLVTIFTVYYTIFYSNLFSSNIATSKDSSISSSNLASLEEESEIVKNIGKLEGNNKIKIKGKDTSMAAKVTDDDVAPDSSSSHSSSHSSTGTKVSSADNGGSASTTSKSTFKSVNKWSINSVKPCSASTLNSQFADFTRSKESFWSSLSQKDKDRYTQEWKDHMKDYDSQASTTTASLSKTSSKSSPRRGVVYAAHPGSVKVTLISIKYLRKHDCDLPIEVWHLDELGSDDKGRLEKMDNVKVFNLKDYGDFQFEREPDGKMFQVKIAAFHSSKLDEILFLDSDNTAVADPTFLFDSPAFVETGAIFWSDFWKTHPKNPIWSILGMDCVDEFEQESGQMLINKNFPGVMRALTLSMYLQQHSSLYFRLLLGDKDTFRLSWRALGQPFHSVRANLSPVGQIEPSKFAGHSMLQYAPFWGPKEIYGPPPESWTDPKSPMPLFIHSNLLKYKTWSADQPDLVFDKVQRYKSRPVVADAVGTYDGSTRLFDIDGAGIETVDLEMIVPGHEKLFRAFYKDSN